MEAIKTACRTHGLQHKHYAVRTIYLGKPDDDPRRRLRQYNGKGDWYIESKKRGADVVDKSRKVYQGDPETEPGWGSTLYERDAYDDDDTLRVTVDNRLENTATGDYFPGKIVEVKFKDSIPAWLKVLLPKPSPKWSKARWLQGKAKIKYG